MNCVQIEKAVKRCEMKNEVVEVLKALRGQIKAMPVVRILP